MSVFQPVATRQGLSGTIDRMTTDEVHASPVGPRDYFVRDGGLSQSYTLCLKPILVDHHLSIAVREHASTRCPGSSDSLPSSVSPAYIGTVFSGQTLTVAFPVEGDLLYCHIVADRTVSSPCLLQMVRSSTLRMQRQTQASSHTPRQER